MVQDIVSLFKTAFDHNDLMIKLPHAFEMLKGKDAEFEMVTSNCIQPMRLEYQGKLVTKSVAVIFVTTEIDKTKVMDQKQKDKILLEVLTD